ncbi:MAG: hypothetical protein U0Z26_17720 [Anaerolineales bacterium]
MGKYSSIQKRTKMQEVDRAPHPIWRGIGCLFMILIPIFSVAMAYEIVNYGIDAKWPIPYQLLGFPNMPALIRNVNSLWALTSPIRKIENFYAYATFSIGIMVILSGVISVLYAFIYQMVGPDRYGPLDVPPLKAKITKKSR